MLTIKIVNVHHHENNHADYRVQVATTIEPLADFMVEDFDRSRGWAELLVDVARLARASLCQAMRRNRTVKSRDGANSRTGI